MSPTNHTTPTPGTDERWVRNVIDSAMSGSQAPRDLHHEALVRGRRLRTRRRLGVAAAAVAVGVVAVTALPRAVSDDGTSPDGSDLVATQPTVPDGPAVPEGYWDMPALTMVTELTELVPEGRIVVDTGPLAADTPGGGAGRGFINPTLGFDVDGAIVRGNVNLMMWPGDPGAALDGVGADETTFTVGPTDALACPGNLIDPVSCAQVLDATGRVVARRSVSQLGEVQVLEFVLSAGDGIVYGATANTDEPKWGADSEVTAPRPPLTMAELEAIVRDDVWTSYEP